MVVDNRYDLVVVGGGPAGATAAIVASRSGARVILVERHRLPRPKLCAGLITAKTVDVIRTRLHGAIRSLRADGIVHTTSHEYKIQAADQPLVTGRMAEPFHLVDRSRYDAHWVAQAEACGARVQTDRAVIAVDAGSHPIRVTTDAGILRADAVIGADGASSRVRAALIRSRHLPRLPIRGRGLALEAVSDAAVWGGHRPLPILVFGVIPGGYGWLFPGPDGGATLGVCGRIRSVRGRFAQAFRHLMDCIESQGASIGPPRAHPLPLGSFYRRPGAGRVLLAGDAAGFADPLLGEGIYYAHASGYLAAEALMGPDPTGHAAVDTYASRLNKSVFRELVWADVWRGALHGLGAWNQYRLLPWLFRRRGRSLEAMVHGRRSFGPGRLNAI